MQICDSVRKGEIGKRFFCQDCQNTRQFQCGFCFKKFFSSSSAEHHINTYHSIETQDDCEICNLKQEFISIPIGDRIKINNRALPKWISSHLRMRRIEKKMQLVCIDNIEDQEQKEEDIDEKIFEVEFPKLIQHTVSAPAEEEGQESYASICEKKIDLLKNYSI